MSTYGFPIATFAMMYTSTCSLMFYSEICFGSESDSHIARTTICYEPIAPSALNHAFDDITSTQADSKFSTFSSTSTWSDARSGGSCRREKCAWRRSKVLKCGAEVWFVQLDGHAIVDAPEENVLMSTNWNGFELC